MNSGQRFSFAQRSKLRQLKRLLQGPQRRQSVAAPGLFAGATAGFKFTAGRRAPFVDGTGSAFTHLAGQGGAAGRAVVGAPHAAQLVGDGCRQACRHAAAAALHFLHGKVDAEAGAAGAAGQARMGHGGVEESRWQ